MADKVPVPVVVKFAYQDFHVEGKKWIATCRTCRVKLTEKKSVTSAFTK